MIDYKGLLKDSWFKFKKNLSLVFPTLLSILFMFGVIVLLLIEGLIISAFSGGAFTFEDIFTAKNIIILIIFGIIDFAIILAIGSYIRSMEIGMLMDVAQKGKTSVSNMFLYGKRLILKYFKTMLFLLLAVYLPIFLIIFGLIKLVLLLTKYVTIFSIISEMSLIKYPIIILGVIILFLLFFAISWFLFFIEPMIVVKKDNPIEITRSSFLYTKKNFKHVLVVWGTVMLVVIIISIALSLIESMFELGKGAFFSFLVLLFGVFQWAVNIIVNLVTRLFIFKSYLAKKE